MKILIFLLIVVSYVDYGNTDNGDFGNSASDGDLICIKQVRINKTTINQRRYDVNDMGYNEYFHGWADVQGQGAANDYCRFVGIGDGIFLACALGGTHGENELSYVTAKKNFDRGYPNTWYMKDEDGDGRDDYCRCVGVVKTQVVCTKAGPKGFYGSETQGGKTLTFTPTNDITCKERVVRPEFGRPYGFVLGEADIRSKP